mmetsp:Transcript_87390/g.250487  ORF Transcript_87390/g.250487 Transcript_87390/m.250487 type:complete len:455 (+) Transcript_87390:1019-2383(+)
MRLVDGKRHAEQVVVDVLEAVRLHLQQRCLETWAWEVRLSGVAIHPAALRVCGEQIGEVQDFDLPGACGRHGRGGGSRRCDRCRRSQGRAIGCKARDGSDRCGMHIHDTLRILTVLRFVGFLLQLDHVDNAGVGRAGVLVALAHIGRVVDLGDVRLRVSTVLIRRSFRAVGRLAERLTTLCRRRRHRPRCHGPRTRRDTPAPANVRRFRLHHEPTIEVALRVRRGGRRRRRHRRRQRPQGRRRGLLDARACRVVADRAHPLVEIRVQPGVRLQRNDHSGSASGALAARAVVELEPHPSGGVVLGVGRDTLQRAVASSSYANDHRKRPLDFGGPLVRVVQATELEAAAQKVARDRASPDLQPIPSEEVHLCHIQEAGLRVLGGGEGHDLVRVDIGHPQLIPCPRPHGGGGVERRAIQRRQRYEQGQERPGCREAPAVTRPRPLPLPLRHLASHPA